MRYQFKGIAGKWNVFDEAGTRIGSVRRSMGGKLEYQYGDGGQAYHIRRKDTEFCLEQDGNVVFTGQIRYPASKSLFQPPMLEELSLKRDGENWTLHQRTNRNIEISYNGTQVGTLKGMVAGTKTMDWNGDEGLLGPGLLCFALGVYMVEDDTVYTV